MRYILILVIVGLIGGGLFFKNNLEPTNLPEQNPTSNAGDLTSGLTLDLSARGLKRVPENVFTREEIETLDLSSNLLEGSLQAEVRNLQNLRVLDLSNNQFTGVPAEVGQLSRLEVLDLSNNRLTGLPYEIGNLSNLKLLNLSGNNYSAADLEIIKSKLPKTTEIRVR